MPSPLTRIPVAASRGLVMSGVAAALLACAGLPVLIVAGCQAGRPAALAPVESRVYPPKPQVTRVIALGNLRNAPPPSKTEVELARFLFGAEPPPPLTLANPTDLTASAECVLVCDGAEHRLSLGCPLGSVRRSV